VVENANGKAERAVAREALSLSRNNLLDHDRLFCQGRFGFDSLASAGNIRRMSFISAGQLQEGLSYLHRNFLFIRTIDRLEGETVLWHDQTGCSVPRSFRELSPIGFRMNREGARHC
jgi:hypothetical protein